MNMEYGKLSEINKTQKDKWSHLYVESKTVKLIKAESRMEVARGGGRGNKEMSVKGHKVSIMQND